MAQETLKGRCIHTGALLAVEQIQAGQLWVNTTEEVRVVARGGDVVRYQDAQGQVHEVTPRAFQCHYFLVLGSAPVASAAHSNASPPQATRPRPEAQGDADEDDGAWVLGLF